MELTYSDRKTGFEQGKNYRNPRHFARPEKADSVVVEGDYPEVVKAYEAIKVPVKTVAAPKKPKATAKTDKPSAATADNQADKE
ncbi:hypothetical protein [Halomonas sp. MS1]|nr:hypothetical protein [Halomonas sp. MS1]UTD55955.1 hypothetical protein NF683_01670 [Halomonas sp. MS1]